MTPAPLFRWTGPDEQKVLCFYYDGYAVMAQGAGLGRRYDSLTEEAITECARRYEKLAAEGSMASLFDKQLNRELLDSKSAYRGNQFVFKEDTWKDASPRTAEIRAVDLVALGAGLEFRAGPTAIIPCGPKRFVTLRVMFAPEVVP